MDGYAHKNTEPPIFIGHYIATLLPIFLYFVLVHFTRSEYNRPIAPYSLTLNFLKRYHTRMCTHNVTEWMPSPPVYSSKRKHRSKLSKVQVYRLTRRRCAEKEGKDMELKNLKLYLENQIIIEENEKLRKKANLLHQENLALMSEFQKKFSHVDRFSSMLFLLLHKH